MCERAQLVVMKTRGKDSGIVSIGVVLAMSRLALLFVCTVVL